MLGGARQQFQTSSSTQSMGVLLVPVFELTRGEPRARAMSERKGRSDEGVKLLAELINKGQRRVYMDFD